MDAGLRLLANLCLRTYLMIRLLFLSAVLVWEWEKGLGYEVVAQEQAGRKTKPDGRFW